MIRHTLPLSCLLLLTACGDGNKQPVTGDLKAEDKRQATGDSSAESVDVKESQRSIEAAAEAAARLVEADAKEEISAANAQGN